MSLETQVAGLISATTSLTGEVSGKMAQIDQRVDQKRNELDSWRAGHLDEHPALCVNFNARFTAVAGSAPYQLPIGMGVHANGDFWNKFDVSFIPVVSGLDPVTRPAVVRELLQFMNMDRQHFSAGFNILKFTVKTVADFGPYVFHIPYQHVKAGPFTSVILYHKIVGRSTWGWMNNGVKDAWTQATNHVYSGNDAGGYVHVDVGIGGPTDVGDTLYLALPQIVPGKWNPEHRAPQFYNLYDSILDVVASGTVSGLGGTFELVTNANR